MHGTYFLHACLAALAALGCHGAQAGRRPRGVCFRNEREAASIASLHLANLQRDIQRTECDSEKIFEVYKNYVSDDVTFTANGQELPGPPLGPGPITGLDDLNTAFIASDLVKGICETTFISWATVNVTVTELGTSFIWRGNEVFSPPDENPGAPAPGRVYSFVLSKRSCRPIITAIDTVSAFSLGPAGGPPSCPTDEDSQED